MNRALLAMLSLALLSCSSLMQTPSKFLRLDEADSEYAYRATSADGVVLAGRVFEFDEDRGGGSAFWIDAIKLRLQSVGGYALLGESDIRTTSGLSGKQLRFGHDQKQGTFQYWVSVFVDGDALIVIEAGGPERKLTEREADIAKAIASLDP